MPPMPATYRLDIVPVKPGVDHHLVNEARAIGLDRLTDIRRSRYYLVHGDLDAQRLLHLGTTLLNDPVLEKVSLVPPDAADRRVLEIQRKNGVMDPVEGSIIKGSRDLGIMLDAVRVGTRVEVAGAGEDDLQKLAWKCLANQAIEEVAIDPADSVRWKSVGGTTKQKRVTVPIDGMDDSKLMDLSRNGCLSLTIDEMRTVQAYFRNLRRDPTDVELETVAQTWSEHCVHKTLKGLIEYHGPEGTVVIDNLLKQTIARATTELNADWCLSVFKDNSGVIEFDREFGVCIKVETHNHPSAIEPYGGANTCLLYTSPSPRD